MAELIKVGDLARLTGLSVRTLHHYEEIGLLAPSQRTASGHRLYDADGVMQLQKVLALKQLGMSLEEIRSWLGSHQFSVVDALRAQRMRVAEQIDMLKSVARRLEVIEKRMCAAKEISVDDVLEALEANAMFEKYYTKEQLAQLEERGKQLGADHIKQVEQEWPQLIAKVKDAKARGVNPADPEMQALAKRWKELVEEFTGGDPGITQSLANMYKNEPSARERTGLDAGLFSYVQEAWRAHE